MARKPKEPPKPVSERAQEQVAALLMRTARLGLSEQSAKDLAAEILADLKENHIVPRTEAD